MTDRISLESLLSNNGNALNDLVDRIHNGAVFVYPTETIYGIGGRADSIHVENRIRLIKEREKKSPFILIASDLSCFSTFDLQFTKKSKLLAKNFWPGNLTMILDSPHNASGFGVRVSDHPFIKALFTELNIPIFSTSANMSDTPYQNNPDAIFSIFNGQIDFMIDAGVLPQSQSSTVVKISHKDECVIVREGVIRVTDIEDVLL